MGPHDMHVAWPALACFIVVAIHAVNLGADVIGITTECEGHLFDHWYARIGTTVLPLHVPYPSPQDVQTQLG